MAQVALFVVVLVAVFAAKAVSIAFTADDIVSNCTSFCWMAPKPEDAVIPAAEQQGAVESAASHVRAYPRHATVA